MAVWVARAGRQGEREEFALDNNVAVYGSSLPDLSQFKTRAEIEEALRGSHPDAKPNTVAAWVAQNWAFARSIQVDDLVVLPLKRQNAIAIGEVMGGYKYRPNNPGEAKHVHSVKWLVQDMPRDRFDPDLLNSFGALQAVFQVKRNNAEERIRAVLSGRPGRISDSNVDATREEEATDAVAPIDLQEYANNLIRAHIDRNFAGHKLAQLVNAVLEAQGYQTQVSDPGPDGGVDIIAGRGPMGFDPPRLCVQVKSGDQQQDVKVLRELKGVMKDFGAEQGLFIAWGGFRRTALAEARRAFFEIRLWDAGHLVDAVLRHYDQFPEDLKADLPLKRIWSLVQEE